MLQYNKSVPVVSQNFYFISLHICMLWTCTSLLIVWFFCLQPLKWELKQKPGMSPPRGGFQPDDPNQQIVADDIFDEYGGIKEYM